MNNAVQPMRGIGDLLRDWRLRRRYSQLALACDAEISPKHLSFIESGRAQPSRAMVIHLAERLDVPLRERNRLLLAAGFAPAFKESASLQDPAIAEVRGAVEFVLARHEPYPALAVDRHWNLVSANRAVAPLMAGAAKFLLDAPVNVLRLSLHPDGLAPRIVNFAQWRRHLFERLARQVEQSGDPQLSALQAELRGYQAPFNEPSADEESVSALVVPLRLRTERGVLSLISTSMVFGTPLDVISSELAIETFFPADQPTAACFTAAG